MIKKIFLIFVLVTFLAFLFNSFCFAQGKGRELEIKYPELGIPEIETPRVTESAAFGEYLKYIFTFAIIIGGLVVFGSLIYGGIRYLTSAGDPTKMSDARDQATAGILGLIILLSSYLILNTINPQLVIIEPPSPETLEKGIYAHVKPGCVDDPDDLFDTPVLITQPGQYFDLKNILPKKEDGSPQPLQCIKFRSGPEDLTVKVYSNDSCSGELTYVGNEGAGATRDIIGGSLELIYHWPGVYLYANEGCDKTGEYKVYQTSFSTLPDFNNKVRSIEFIYGFSDKGAIQISKQEYHSQAEAENVANDRCQERGGKEIEFITETEYEFQYRCRVYDKKYAAILHEEENFMGEAALFDQEKGVCQNLSDNMGPNLNGRVSSMTLYFKSLEEAPPGGVKFFGDEKYTHEKDDYVLPESGYYGKDTNIASLGEANDKITSMEMKGHYVALLFDEENYRGECEVFMASEPNFRNHRIGQCGWWGRDDCLSSFIIRARK